LHLRENSDLNTVFFPLQAENVHLSCCVMLELMAAQAIGCGIILVLKAFK